VITLAATDNELARTPPEPSNPPTPLHHSMPFILKHPSIKQTWAPAKLNHHPRTSIQSFWNFSALSTIGWCPENFVMISLTVLELSCWQTDRQTDTQTDTTENKITIEIPNLTRYDTRTLSASIPIGITSNVQCVLLAAGRRTQAGDATDQWRDQWKSVNLWLS